MSTQAQTGNPAILLLIIPVTPLSSVFGVPLAEPVSCPLALPVACPLALAVACPLALAVACPLALPVACPLALPVACPLALPVACPLAEAVACPLALPVACPLAEAVACPLAEAVACPVVDTVVPAVVALPVVVADDAAPPEELKSPPLDKPQQGPPVLNTLTVEVVTTEFEPVVAPVEVAPPGIGVALPVVWNVASPVMMAGSVMVLPVKKDANVTAFGTCIQFVAAEPKQSSPVSKRFGQGIPPV